MLPVYKIASLNTISISFCGLFIEQHSILLALVLPVGKNLSAMLLLGDFFLSVIPFPVQAVVHGFNPSTWEAETGRSL